MPLSWTPYTIFTFPRIWNSLIVIRQVKPSQATATLATLDTSWTQFSREAFALYAWL